MSKGIKLAGGKIKSMRHGNSVLFFFFLLLVLFWFFYGVQKCTKERPVVSIMARMKEPAQSF